MASKKATPEEEVELNKVEQEEGEKSPATSKVVKIQERTYALNKINACSIDEVFLTLVNPVVTLEDEKYIALAEKLVKTGKLIEIK